LAIDALEKRDDCCLVLETPPDPRTGATSIELDPLEWIHAPGNQDGEGLDGNSVAIKADNYPSYPSPS
jgi:hypothetical protein